MYTINRFLLKLTLTLALFYAETTYCQCELTFESNQLDLGNIEFEREYRCTFKFKNTGKETVFIRDCRTSGGGLMCYGYPKDSIAVMDSGIIVLAYKSSGFGSYCKSATVTTSCLQYSLTMKCNVIMTPQITFDNSKIDLGLIEATNAVKGNFIVKNHGYAPLVIQRVKSNKLLYFSHCPDTIATFSEKSLQFYVHNENNSDSFNDSIYLYTNASSSPDALIISGKVKYSPLRIKPISNDAFTNKMYTYFSIDCTNTCSDTLFINSYETENSYYASVIRLEWTKTYILPFEKIRLTLALVDGVGSIDHLLERKQPLLINMYTNSKNKNTKYTNTFYIDFHKKHGN